MIPAAPGAEEGVDPTLRQMDAAMLGLRHVWAGPGPRHPVAGGSVELSTVWIVDTLVRAEARGTARCSVGELAEALDVAHSTASRLLDRAVATGMVSRGRASEDARQVSATLTAAGRMLATESLAFRTAYLSAFTEDWTSAERATFAELLTRFAAAAAVRRPIQQAQGR